MMVQHKGLMIYVVNIEIIVQCHLRLFSFFRSTGVTDLGISAIACGCPGLEMINTAYCTSITDRALFSLSKCANLKALEIRGCLLVTSIGLASIAMNCKQLSRLDIKKCYNINDSGMIPLAHFSQNLRQVGIFFVGLNMFLVSANMSLFSFSPYKFFFCL